LSGPTTEPTEPLLADARRVVGYARTDLLDGAEAMVRLVGRFVRHIEELTSTTPASDATVTVGVEATATIIPAAAPNETATPAAAPATASKAPVTPTTSG
jgi:hypothetical protein